MLFPVFPLFFLQYLIGPNPENQDPEPWSLWTVMHTVDVKKINFLNLVK